MAGLNVAEWSPDQVAEWMSGLGPKVAQYVPTLRERGLDGAKLLMLRCDDLEYLGMHIIGHQELLLEAVEHLRNFQYELSRECVQQLAVRVSVVATTLARTLRHAADARLETHTLADVARTVQAVKPLVCWLDRWAGAGRGAAPLAERKAALLKLSLEAATCAQRDRFAEQPARAVAAAAAAAAAAADYIIQEVSSPAALQPAVLESVSLRQRGRALGFSLEPSCCGPHQLADIRFGSPAHASGAVHPGDEIVQVGGQCVVGWSGEAVVVACQSSGSGGSGELCLRLRRRGARPPPALASPSLHARTRHSRMHRVHYERAGDRSEGACGGATPPAPVPASVRGESPASSSDESEPLSPPASPTHPLLDPARSGEGWCGRGGGRGAAARRRHSVSGGSPVGTRPAHDIEQFWQELKEGRFGAAGGSAGHSPAPDDVALYARDKAASCSTGLQLSARPRTCPPPAAAPPPPPPPPPRAPNKLDKSHSTPAYEFTAAAPGVGVGAGAGDSIPEAPATPADSPTILVHSAEKADQILDFKKSSSQIGEAILQQHHRRPTDDKSDQLIDKMDVNIAPKRSDVTEAGFTFKKPESSGSKLESDLGLDVEGTGERDESTTEKILETINIAMMEHRRRSILDGRAIESARVTRLNIGDCGKVEDNGEEQKTNINRCPPSPACPPCPPPRAPLAPLASCAPPGVLRAVREPRAPDTLAPLKPLRNIDAGQISVPLRHITKHDIRVIPSERRELPAINSEAESPAAPAHPAHPAHPARRGPDIVLGAHAGGDSSPARGIALSPTSAVRGIFPNSKSRSLKKKSSILAKRRSVPARALAARGAAGGVWQRVRARHAMQPRWARRHLLLTHNLLYAYRTPECSKADCMIYLEGFTVCAAGEVKSRAHAFKVYHTGTAFYFACDSRDAMLAWIQLIHRATLLPSIATHVDVSKQFSETDYSETESDSESPEKRSEKEKEKDKDKEKDNKEKDKSKFGSLKKLTHRMQRSESQENVSHASTSLDRKYLRFFSRNKSKDDSKGKSKSSASSPGARSAAAVEVSAGAGVGGGAGARAGAAGSLRASNPNLSGEVRHAPHAPHAPLAPHAPHTPHTPHTPPARHIHKAENLMGLVTLEQFMLKKQEEERRQMYSERVLLGVERRLAAALDAVVADVIYGEVGGRGGAGTAARRAGDGYERIEMGPRESDADVDPSRLGYETIDGDESPPRGAPAPPAVRPAPPPPRPRAAPPPLAPDRWRDSLRRNDKVHNAAETRDPPPARPPHPLQPPRESGGAGGAGGGGEPAAGGVSRLRLVFAHDQRSGGGGGGPYPHLQCPPTFQPETYSLSRPPASAPAPAAAPAAAAHRHLRH